MTEALDLTTAAGRAMAGLPAIFADFEKGGPAGTNSRWIGVGPTDWKPTGPTMTAALHSEQVRKLYRADLSKTEIARRLQIGRTSVHRIMP